MAELIFTAAAASPAPVVADLDAHLEKFEKLKQFENYRFGIYSYSYDENGDIRKTVEHNPLSGERFSPDRLDTSLSFSEATDHITSLLQSNGTDNFGLILYVPDDLLCVDFDGSLSDSIDSKIRDAHFELLESAPSWTERSISGFGMHAFYSLQTAEAELLTNTNNPKEKVDTRVRNGFVFLTGDVINEHPISAFSILPSGFRNYLFHRCANSIEATRGSNAAWREEPDYSDSDVVKHLYKHYAESASFLFSRQDQTGASDRHYGCVRDLIRSSLNYEQVKRIYLASECAEYAYRSSNRANLSEKGYIKWLLRNVHSAAHDLTEEGQFFHLDDINIDLEGNEDCFKYFWSDEVDAYTPTSWVVQGIVPSKGVVSVYGPSGSGKTFLVLDMMAAIAANQEWFGRKTQPVPVTYVGLEGENGLRNRIYAYTRQKGDLKGMMIITESLDMRNQDDVVKLLRSMRATGRFEGVLCIDTLAKSAPGMDENDSVDMGLYVKIVETLAKETNGVVILVHHTGKDTDRGMRGHSSLQAGIDVAIQVNRDEGSIRSWETKKVKDGSDDAHYKFALHAVEVGIDQWGNPEYSCVIGDAPDISALLDSATINECEQLGQLMIESNVDYFNATGGSNSVFSLLNEMPNFPSRWTRKKVKELIEAGLKSGYFEEYEWNDGHRNKKRGVRVSESSLFSPT